MDSFAELGSLARDTARCRSLGALFLLASASALTGALVACGGGGGGDAPAPPPAPTPSPAPAPIAAQLTVPTPVGYDADRLAAFNRLNEIRLSAGLGMLAQSTEMDQAAQAHAEWMIGNDSFVHVETPGTVGFTGADWWNRVEAFGYVPLGGDEVMSEGATAAAGVDVLVNAVYHRAGMLAFEPVDVGVGWSSASAASFNTPLVLDITTPGGDPVRDLGQLPQPAIGGVAVWPLDGAASVPTRLGLESPNPVPGVDVLSLGTPASVTVSSSVSIASGSFVITDVGAGSVVPTAALTNLNDPNFLIPPSFIAAVPLAPLKPNASYSVVFDGVLVDSVLGTPMALHRAWQFMTGPQ